MGTWGRCLGLLDASGCWFPEVQWPDPWHRPRWEFSVTPQPMRDWFHPENETMEPPKSWVYGLEDAEIRTRVSEFKVPSSIWIIWRVCSAVAICGHRNDTCFFMLSFFFVFRISCEVWTGVDHWGSFSLQEWQLGPNIPVPSLVSRAEPFPCQAERELMRLKEHGGMVMMVAVGWFPELFQFWDTLGIRDTPEFQDVSICFLFFWNPCMLGSMENKHLLGSLGASFISACRLPKHAKIWPFTEVLGHWSFWARLGTWSASYDIRYTHI